jgi:hypothetical protein
MKFIKDIFQSTAPVKYAVIVFTVTVLGTAQSSSHPHTRNYYSSSSSHYSKSIKLDSKSGPSSTPRGGPAVGVNKTSVTAQNSELNRLEHQTATQIQAPSKHQVRPVAEQGHSRVTRSREAEHNAPINFSYRPPQSGHSSSNSVRSSSGSHH